MPKEQSWAVGRPVIEVVFAVGMAFLTAFLTRKTEHSIVEDTNIGLLSLIALAYILEPVAQRRSTHSLRESVAKVEQTIVDMKKDINALHSGLGDQMERSTFQLRFTNKDLARDEMPSAWEQMLWAMRGNLDATSYIRPQDYVRSYPDLGVEIQRTKIQVANIRIRRIFILENEGELERIRPHIAKQIAANVEVSYVLFSEIVNSPFIDVSRYKTFDFGLFHGSGAVFLWFLDGSNRSLSGGRIELDTDQKRAYEAYKPLFEELCKMSRKFPPDFKVENHVPCVHCAAAALQHTA